MESCLGVDVGYDAKIRRQALSAVVDLKGDQNAVKKWFDEPSLNFPSQPNTTSLTDDIELYWVGPEHWLLRAPADKENELRIKTLPQSVPMEISAVLVSDTLSFFEIVGTDAHHVMMVVSPLDFHPNIFPDNSASYTEAFGLKTLIIRRTDKFELAVELSHADMTEDFLHRIIS